MDYQGNPNLGNKLQLFCEHGFLLTIRPNGDISGTADNETDPHTRLIIQTADATGLVRIQGIETGLYVCFNSDGDLYGDSNPEMKGTVFFEHFQGSYTAYKSVAYPEWFIGLKKTGDAKNGQRTAFGQKAVKFLPIRVGDE